MNHKKQAPSNICWKTLFPLFALAFLAGNPGCEDYDSQSIDDAPLGRIINGEETNYERWKGVVGLYIPGEYMDHICTGTLIDPQVVLTAGHCVYMPDEGIDVVNAFTSGVEIMGGAYMERSYTNADWIVIHEKWKADIYDPFAVDLAMIKLEDPIPSLETYGISETPLEVGQKGYIVGYGNNTNFGGDQIHREGETTVIELPAGNRVFEIGYPTGTCRGDSGGPFFALENDNWVVAGVTSYGSGTECLAHTGNWNVLVRTYRSWIDSTLVKFTGHGIRPNSSPTDPIEDDTDSAGTPFGMDTTNPFACLSVPAPTGSKSSLLELLTALF